MRYFAKFATLALAAGASVDASAASRQVQAVATLAQAGSGSVTFVNDRRYLADLGRTTATACFLRPQDAALPLGHA